MKIGKKNSLVVQDFFEKKYQLIVSKIYNRLNSWQEKTPLRKKKITVILCFLPFVAYFLYLIFGSLWSINQHYAVSPKITNNLILKPKSK